MNTNFEGPVPPKTGIFPLEASRYDQLVAFEFGAGVLVTQDYSTRAGRKTIDWQVDLDGTIRSRCRDHNGNAHPGKLELAINIRNGTGSVPLDR